MSTAGDIAQQIGLNLIERAVEQLPELAGIIARGLAGEPNKALVDLVRARLPQVGESERAAREIRARQGG